MIAGTSADPRPSSTSLAFSTRSWIIPQGSFPLCQGKWELAAGTKEFYEGSLEGKSEFIPRSQS